MIKNERQYRITKTQAGKFAQALRERDTRSVSDPLLKKIEQDALQSQLEDLQNELREYEALRAGELSVITLSSFEEFPRALVQARIAARMSQKDLAEKLGLKEQQVQRYEATDYVSASIARVREVVEALGIRVCEDLYLPSAPLTCARLFDRLKAVGIDWTFVRKRILPPAIAGHFTSRKAKVADNIVLRAAAIIGRVFQWTVEQIVGPEPLQLKTAAAGIARFKLPSRRNEQQLSAYTMYAYFLANCVLEATQSRPVKPIPAGADECRRAIVSSYGEVTFENTLRYVWDLGVPVLPLGDSGAFNGACWRIQGRNVVVLKQRTASLTRWLHDLLHELYHAGQEPGEEERSIIEGSETSPERRESEEEQQASVFAGDVILEGRAEELASLCVNASGGVIQRLKSAVQRVAVEQTVDTGALANYMAFRLALQDVNWWGTAANLQRTGSDPWEVARDEFLARVDIRCLGDADQSILLQALTEPEE